MLDVARDPFRLPLAHSDVAEICNLWVVSTPLCATEVINFGTGVFDVDPLLCPLVLVLINCEAKWSNLPLSWSPASSSPFGFTTICKTCESFKFKSFKGTLGSSLVPKCRSCILSTLSGLFVMSSCDSEPWLSLSETSSFQWSNIYCLKSPTLNIWKLSSWNPHPKSRSLFNCKWTRSPVTNSSSSFVSKIFCCTVVILSKRICTYRQSY